MPPKTTSCFVNIIRTFGLGVLSLLVISCTQVGDSWLIGSMASAAKDQIMLVRKDPPSFGFHRLETHLRAYPDLGVFVSRHGLPDFLAETGSRDRHYFILYYLADREAFAGRTRQGAGSNLEFAGPYPITRREFRILDGFRRNPGNQPPAW